MDIKNTGLYNLKEKLQGNIKFTVPIYQREYSWTKYECNTLLNDLKKFSDDLLSFNNQNISSDRNNRFKYFLGMMMIREKRIEGYYVENMIVDGQQRITTIFILLSAIKNWIEDNKSSLKDKKNLDDILDVCENILFLTPNNESILISKLNSISDSGLLKEFAKDGFHHKNNKSYFENKSTNISKNYEFFYNEIDSFEYIETIIEAINSTQILWVQLSNFEDENQIFESINFKGVKLTTSDLIKNLLFSNEDQKLDNSPENENQFNSISRTYNNIMTKFNIKNETKLTEELDELYRYYVSYFGDFSLVKAGYEVYKNFKSNLHSKYRSSSTTIKNIEDEIIDLSKFFGSFCEIKNILSIENDKLKKSIKKLPLLYNLKSIYSQSDTLYWLPIYALLNKLDLILVEKKEISGSKEWLFDTKIEWGNNSKLLEECLKIIDGFDMYVVVMNNGSNKNITRAIPILAKKISEYSGNINDLPNFIRDKLVDCTENTRAAESDKEYSSLKNALTSSRMYSINKSTTKRILLNMNNNKLIDKDYIELDFKDKTKGIEHIIPSSINKLSTKIIDDDLNGNQISKNLREWNNNITKRKDDLNKIKERLDTLPNLVYISNRDNLELSNKPFNEKMDIVTKKGLSSIVYKDLIFQLIENWKKTNETLHTFSEYEMNLRINEYIDFFKQYKIIK